MKLKNLIVTVIVAGCAGLAAEAWAGPGSGPYGPFGKEGAYGGFGPYSPYVSRGIPIHEGPIVERQVTYISQKPIWVEKTTTTTYYAIPAKTVLRHRTYAVKRVIYMPSTPAPVGEREVSVVGGRRTIVNPGRTTPSPVGEAAVTTPGPTVAPPYSNSDIDYANPYR